MTECEFWTEARVTETEETADPESELALSADSCSCFMSLHARPNASNRLLHTQTHIKHTHTLCAANHRRLCPGDLIRLDLLVKY